jgi:endoglucanase
MKETGLLAVVALVMGLAGCGGGSSSGGGSPSITVDISPKTASVVQSSTLQFNATVGGTANTAVTWSVAGGAGSISSGGLYTAPATPGTYSVKVTTQATPAASNTATVTVTAGTPATLAWRAVSLSGAEWGEGSQAQLMTGTYGADWYYPTTEEVAYFKGKGMNMVRIPFRWERMQPTLGGALDQVELGRLKSLVSSATASGMTVLIDVHNYARYGYDVWNSKTNLIGSTAVPVSAFVDLWSRLATEFKGNPKVMFGLMNEPHDMDIHVWVNAANLAITAIRNAGATTNTITVPGIQWTGAWAWSDTWYTTDGTSNATEMLKITDSGNNLLFEVHQYLDANYSGVFDTTKDSNSSNDCVHDYTTLVKFTAWLKANNKKGLLGELGAPNTAACNTAIDGMLSHVQANADVWSGWMWWAAGPKWGTYPLSIEPAWSGTWPNLGTVVPNSDKPQMSVLAPYLK